ncbi:hypothetical protein [Thiolapillus sp.]|uniref:hypothetical protein n=1 Tax=Thiolapillus sp. TaxID=2017437 RepID=UPI003AFA00B4
MPKVLCISVQSAIFFEQIEGFSEHGIFHGIAVWQENKSLNIKDKKGLLIIEWESSTACECDHA